MRPSVSSIDPTLTQRLLCYLSFAKEKIALAPNNPSAWNYLRGALEHTNMPFSTVATFVEPYTTSQPPSREMNDDVVDLDNPPPSAGAQLPAVAALEFMADIYEKEGGDATAKAVEVYRYSSIYSRRSLMDIHVDLEVARKREGRHAQEVRIGH